MDDASPMVGKALMLDPDHNPEPGTCNVAISVDSRYGLLGTNNSRTLQVLYDGQEPNRPSMASPNLIQTGQAGQVVTLNGTGSSDPDGNDLTYQWRQIEGASVTLVGDGTATPTFTAPDSDHLQTFKFELVVSDGRLESQPSNSTILVTPN